MLMVKNCIGLCWVVKSESVKVLKCLSVKVLWVKVLKWPQRPVSPMLDILNFAEPGPLIIPHWWQMKNSDKNPKVHACRVRKSMPVTRGGEWLRNSSDIMQRQTLRTNILSSQQFHKYCCCCYYITRHCLLSRVSFGMENFHMFSPNGKVYSTCPVILFVCAYLIYLLKV